MNAMGRKFRRAAKAAAKVKLGDAPRFQSDITETCANCSRVDIALMVRRAHKFMSKDLNYYLGTFQEIRAKSRECQLCRAWLELTPKFEGLPDGEYPEHNTLTLETTSTYTKGTFKLLEDNADYDDKRLHTVRLSLFDRINRRRGPEFTATVNSGSFYLHRDDIRWNEISSQIDFSLPRTWMKFCLENHTICRSAHASGSETLLDVLRLIDCDKTLSTGQMQIFRPSDAPEYVALSYVWGKKLSDDQKVQSSSADSKEVQTEKEGLLEYLPLVIRDSVLATMQLGLRYLWIDQYCIDQDDSKAKHETIMKMDLIYATAALTLVAAAGSDSDHGLSGVGLTARNPLNSVEVSNSLRFVSVKHAEDCIRDTTWATRAWTLQEGLLAKRRLVFTSEQMFFECQEMQVAETVAVPLEVLHESHVTSRLEGGYFHAMANHHILYYRIVWIFRNYTRRSLSYSADRINAFQGILNSMKPTMTHVWGLPISADEDKMGSFIGSLGWEHDKTWFREFRDQVKRSPEFPSWSWAAWEGQQDYSSLNSTKDLRVKFYLTDGSPVDLSNESTKEELRGLESKATHRFTLQTFILNPDSITAHDSKLYLYHEARQNFFEPMKVQHYLGRDEDDKTLEQIRIGVFKLIYVGTVHHAASRIQPQMRFIVGRNKEDSLERIGLMKVKLGTSEDEMAYLRSNANFMSIDLV